MSSSETSKQVVAKQEEQPAAVKTEPIMSGRVFSPQLDIFETEDEILLLADLPGVKPDDLRIDFENKELVLYGKVSPRGENVENIYAEYALGDFHRKFAISDAIDPEKISAELKHGVLTLHLPKTELVKPRRILVNAS